MGDHPFYEVCKTADAHIKKGRQVFQKFTCEKCGLRLTMEEPNIFYEVGHCEKCNHYSDLKANGHNYMVIAKGDDGMVLVEELSKNLRP